jgi:hypothetical protein
MLIKNAGPKRTANVENDRVAPWLERSSGRHKVKAPLYL